MNTQPDLVVTDHGHVRLLTINRPERLNALSRALGAEFEAQFRAADRDPAVRVVVVTGAGERSFCAGGDLKEMAEDPRPGGRGERTVRRMFERRMDKPLIAAVNGLAHGGGLEMVLACDVAVAADHAEFALPEVRRGLLATGGGLVRLPEIVGPRRAMEMALTGGIIDAATALSWGMVNAVVPGHHLLERALELAAQIAANAPLSVMASKAVITHGARMSEADVWELNEKHQAVVAASADAVEGPRSFAERRQPEWTGR